MSNAIAIGLDFGTTHCKMGVVDEYGRAKVVRNAEGEETTPTVVAFDGPQTPIVGREAYRQALAHPQDTLAGFKLELGNKNVLYRDAAGRAYTATDLTALELGKLKQDAEQALGGTIERAVLTCPANFQQDARDALLQAAAQAGLTEVKLVPEPTAAAVAYGLQHGVEQTIVVFDLGGGTFDVTVARCKGEQTDVLGTSGEPRLGCRDFVNTIQEYVAEKAAAEMGFRPNPQKEVVFYEDLRQHAEDSLRTLTVRENTTITVGARGKYATVSLSRATFEQMTRELIDRAVKTTNDLLELIGKPWKEIDKLVLVGGGSKIPVVKAAIEQASGLRASQDIDAIHAVSFGAAILAAAEQAKVHGAYMIDGRAIPGPKPMLKDVTAYAIGCKVDDANLGLSNAVVIPRNKPIPARVTKCFRLKYPDQTHAEIVLMEGNEGEPEERCLILGRMELTDLPPDASLPLRIEILVEIDASGLISGRATDKISGKTVAMQIDYARGIKKAS